MLEGASRGSVREADIWRFEVSKKSKPLQLTRGETELLLQLVDAAPHISSMSKARLSAILPELTRKAWSAWADTHPEDGPFK